MEIKHHNIVLVNLDPTIGCEINKTRLCVVISPDEMNKYLRTLVIAPMTSQSKECPTRIEVHHNGKISWVVIDQIRTIDKMRIVKVLDRFFAEEIVPVKSVIKETFVY